jgi:hypothetical protein
MSDLSEGLIVTVTIMWYVVAKVRERLAVGKRMVKKMDVERFNLKQLHQEVKEQYQVTIKISLQLWKT